MTRTTRTRPGRAGGLTPGGPVARHGPGDGGTGGRPGPLPCGRPRRRRLRAVVEAGRRPTAGERGAPGHRTGRSRTGRGRPGPALPRPAPVRPAGPDSGSPRRAARGRRAGHAPAGRPAIPGPTSASATATSSRVPKGFRTGYTHTPGELREASTLCVVTNPRNARSDAAAFGDHTTGRGKMLAVNGSDLPDQVLWGQDVTVKPRGRLHVHPLGRLLVLDVPGRAGSPDQRAGDRPGGRPADDRRVEGVPGDVGGRKAEGGRRNLQQDREVSGNDFAIDDISLRGPAP